MLKVLKANVLHEAPTTGRKTWTTVAAERTFTRPSTSFQGISVDPGQQTIQRAGPRGLRSQTEAGPDLGRITGCEPGDGHQDGGTAEKYDGAQSQQPAEPALASARQGDLS